MWSRFVAVWAMKKFPLLGFLHGNKRNRFAEENEMASAWGKFALHHFIFMECWTYIVLYKIWSNSPCLRAVTGDIRQTVSKSTSQRGSETLTACWWPRVIGWLGWIPMAVEGHLWERGHRCMRKRRLLLCTPSPQARPPSLSLVLMACAFKNLLSHLETKNGGMWLTAWKSQGSQWA